MAGRWALRAALAGVVFLAITMGHQLMNAQEPAHPDSVAPAAPAPQPEFPKPRQLDEELPDADDPMEALKATTIRPYRSAEIASEVQGIIETFAFEEGDYVLEGRIVAEISTKRYTIMAAKARDAVEGLEFALRRAERQLTIFKQLLNEDAATRQDVLKAESDRDIAAANLKQGIQDLELAKLNLEYCRVRAPFSGYLAERFRQPYESVDRLQKIFSLVDTKRVYAVANVAERLAPRLPKGAAATFTVPGGKHYPGKVDKVGVIIDPKSSTKRVFVLIDNPDAELEVGMTGLLRPSRSGHP